MNQSKDLLILEAILFASSEPVPETDLKDKISSIPAQTQEVEKINVQIKKIKQDSKNELKKLNDIINDINNEKNVLVKTRNKTDSENILSF